MSFAEQLAARAKEKETHHMHDNVSKSQQQNNTIKPQPGKIKPIGSSVFADQLRKSALSSSLKSSGSSNNKSILDDDLHKKQSSQRSLLIPKNTSSFDSEDEYSSVGFSLMDVSTDKSIDDDAIESNSISSSTQPSASASFKTKRKKKIRPISKSTETTPDKPQEMFQNVELSPIKSYTTQESDDTTTSKAKHAWAQIETLKSRVQEAEERARSERQRAEEASFELQRVKEKQDHDRQKVDESTTSQSYKGEGEEHISQQQNEDEEAEALQWKKRALEAEERLVKEVERLERAATRTNTSRLDTSDPDIIHLKNAEIDVLRSQIQRLERRLQVERDRSDEMYMLNRDTPPLVVAECSATQPSNDEYRMLRNEIRHLQYQLGDTSRLGGGATGSTGESTLSTLDDTNDYPTNVETPDEENEVLVDEEDDINAQASSCWCCFRGKSKKGYGRV